MEKSKFLEAVEVTPNVLRDFIFMCESRSKPTYFTRQGKNKLDFISTILFMLNFVKKSFQNELDSYFKLIGKEGKSISKQGFCEARKKIKPEAFIKLFDTIVDWFYREKHCKKFMGFQIFAIDASILEINNSKKYKYTANNNLLIGKLKDHLIYLILEKSMRRRRKQYKQILNDIKRN